MALLAKVQAYIHTHTCFKWHTFSQHTHTRMLEVTQTHRTTYTYLNRHPPTAQQHTHTHLLQVTQTHKTTTHTHACFTIKWHRPTDQQHTHTHTRFKRHRPTEQLHTNTHTHTLHFTIKWHRPTDQQHTHTHTHPLQATQTHRTTTHNHTHTHTHTLHFTIKWHKPTEQQHTHTCFKRPTEQHLHIHMFQVKQRPTEQHTHTPASSDTETHRTTTSTHMHASSETETHRTATGHLPESWLWFAWRWHGAEGQGQWGRTAWRMARPARSDPVCPACCLDVESEHTHTPVHCQQCVVHPLPPTPYLSLTSNCLECDIWTYIHTHGHSI